MSLRITLIQGGGIGLDQAPAVQRIVNAAGVSVEWDEHFAGLASVERGGPPLPADVVESVRATGLALKTKLLSPPGPPQGNANLRFRHELGLFASVRPLKNLRGLPARFQGVDMLVIRELTEDLYAAIEHEIVPGVVQSLKIVTETASRRFFQFAFEWSRNAGRKTVHCVHKANILKLADGLFLEAFRCLRFHTNRRGLRVSIESFHPCQFLYGTQSASQGFSIVLHHACAPLKLVHGQARKRRARSTPPASPRPATGRCAK